MTSRFPKHKNGVWIQIRKICIPITDFKSSMLEGLWVGGIHLAFCRKWVQKIIFSFHEFRQGTFAEARIKWFNCENPWEQWHVCDSECLIINCLLCHDDEGWVEVMVGTCTVPLWWRVDLAVINPLQAFNYYLRFSLQLQDDTSRCYSMCSWPFQSINMVDV